LQIPRVAADVMIEYITQTALCSILMIERLMLDRKVAVYCKAVLFTPNRIHGQNVEFVNLIDEFGNHGVQRIKLF